MMRWSVSLFALIFMLLAGATVRDMFLHRTAAEAVGALRETNEDVNRLLAEIAAQNKMSTNVNWMGHPMFFEGDNANGSFHWADDVELGCRGDGVVVWKRIPVDEKAPTIKVPYKIETNVHHGLMQPFP